MLLQPIDFRSLTCIAGMICTLGACGLVRADDQATTIVVGGDVNHEAVHAFQRANGRKPTREDLLTIHHVWIDNEILYREGLKLPLDPSESANREKVIFKALDALDAKVRPSSATDEELRRWFESHRDKYEQPARFDFEDAALAGQSSEAAVRTLVENLNGGAAAEARASLRVFTGRTESNVALSYGPEVADALAKSQPGKWQPMRARDGWRALRLVAMKPAIHAAFETERDAVRRDWIDATAAQRRSAAV